ncbi:MAG: hypothetical protein ACFE9S_08080 [Candidatus Hermodarchaeota archaeon]
MEKVKLSKDSKIESLTNKEKVGKKIDSLWSESPSISKNSKHENKKLIIKLETTGIEKRRISLKLESESPQATSSNFILISELIKEFFNGSNSFK